MLCGHLLFYYAPIADGGPSEQPDFDLNWHRRALAELLRVSRREVRVYPAHTIERHLRWQGHLEPTAYDEGLEGETPLSRA